MDDFNKQKLDELFQEGSERYDFTYREDAWTSMDGMLDQQEKKRKYRFLGWWIIVGVTALVGVFGLKHYTSDQQTLAETKSSEQNLINSQTKNITGSTELNDDTQITTLPENENNNIDASNSSPKKTEVPNLDLPRKLNEKDYTNNNDPKNQPIATTVESFSNTEKTTFLTRSAEKVALSNPKNVVRTNKIGAESTVAQSTKTVQTNPVLLSSTKIVLLEEPTFALTSIQVPPILLEDEPEKVNDEKQKRGKRFSVGLSAGPEYSFVGGAGQAKAGYYLGLEFGYQLTNRIELITGVGISKKRYLGEGTKYKTEPGFWTDAIAPMQFDGTCTVIEIPLAMNYYFSDVNENGWFASLGATTYLMSSEWYDFIYDPSINRTDLKTSWNDKMANNHILGIGQVSFGYQHRMGKNTSLQISPYVKIPLTGIGNGSVNLFSTGLRVTARFK